MNFLILLILVIAIPLPFAFADSELEGKLLEYKFSHIFALNSETIVSDKTGIQYIFESYDAESQKYTLKISSDTDTLVKKVHSSNTFPISFGWLDRQHDADFFGSMQKDNPKQQDTTVTINSQSFPVTTAIYDITQTESLNEGTFPNGQNFIPKIIIHSQLTSKILKNSNIPYSFDYSIRKVTLDAPSEYREEILEDYSQYMTEIQNAKYELSLELVTTDVDLENYASEASQSQSNESSFVDLPDMLLTKQGTISLSKEKIVLDKKPIPLQIHGKAAGYLPGDIVEIIIETPTGQIHRITPSVASAATYVANINLEPSDPKGVYAVVAMKNDEMIAKASLMVEKGTDLKETKPIPDWVKNNAKWWAEGQIDDNSFSQGIQFLIKEGVMKIPPTAQGEGLSNNEIPSWIKNNAKWWAEGQIDDDSFIQGIQFMIKEGIVKVK